MQALARLSVTARGLWAADADLKDQQHHAGKQTGCLGMLALAWASIGVIYGDIGTSPLYVYSTIFDKKPTQLDVVCATSLIFWSITLVVLVKYVFIILFADDNGEGGTFALYATICRACGIPAVNSGPMPGDRPLLRSASAGHSVKSSAVPTPSSSTKQLKLHAHASGTQQHPSATMSVGSLEHPEGISMQTAGLHNDQQDNKAQVRDDDVRLSWLGTQLRHQLSHNRTAQRVLLGSTLLMTAMVLGDGVLTPSISVLSAVSGLQVKAGLTNTAVIGITCAILVVLFAIQSWGTQRVGVLFAPTVALWFISNVLVGIYNICMFEGGAIFRALSPHYIGVWFQTHGTEGWMSLAGVFLCLTGCEAMFADLGHFNRQSIQLSFVFGVYPSLILTYLGQASWLMHNLGGYSTVFYSSLPLPVFWPIFVVSVLASIVASQALITGSFSMVYQSMAMGCFPRFRVHHTSEDVGGQVYIPEVNYTLLVLCIAVVAGFQSGTAIGNAYGIAVNMVMFSTVILVALVMLLAWGTHPLLVMMFLVPFIAIEGVFLSANILNIPHGGWFSITLAVVLSATNILWIWGTAQKSGALKREQIQLSDLLTTKPAGSGNQVGMGGGLSSQGWRLFRTCNGSPVHRNPGMALVYSESPFNVPAVFKRLVESWGVHSIVVFLTVRQVPMPHVKPQERLLLAPLEFRGFYKCVARYGYMDKVDQGEAFAQSILDKIAEQMPTHAMADGVIAHRAHATHGSSTGTSPAGSGTVTPHEGFNARSIPNLPPSIAEESGSASNSGDGSTAHAPPASSQQSSDLALAAPLAHFEDPGTGDTSTMAAHKGGTLTTPTGEISLTHDYAAMSHQGGLQISALQLGIPSSSETSNAGLGLHSHRHTNWESRRSIEGSLAVSDLAAHTVYVLHRSIIQVQPTGGKVQSALRKFLMEVVYQQLWHLTSRFWEGWHVPAARMFEVGMVVEI